MTEEIKITEVEVQKLNLRPGDVLVFTVPENKATSWMHRFVAAVNKILPRNPAMVVSGDVKISIVPKTSSSDPKESTDGREA